MVTNGKLNTKLNKKQLSYVGNCLNRERVQYSVV